MNIIALCVFSNSHPSKRFSDSDRSLFTPDSQREVNAIYIKQIIYNKYYINKQVLYKTNNECFYSCNGKNIFIRWKMKCSIQIGFASLN
jgi:hypothetical protein